MRAFLAASLSLAMIPGVATADAAHHVNASAPIRLTFRVGSSICIAGADGTRPSGLVRLRPQWFVSRASWSPRGKYAALLRGRSGLVVIDQRARLVRTLIRHFSYGPDDPVWSPDGRWIAVEGGGHGGSIGLIPAARGGGWDNWRLLWETPSLSDGLDSPTWTADSRHLAFAAYFVDPKEVSGVYTIGINGSGFQLLIPRAGNPAYSPDASQLAYVRDGDIWVSDADGSNPRRVTTSGDAARPAWSPRGRLIAFERTVDGHTSIHAIRPDGSDERVLVSSPRYDATMPSWRPPTQFHGGRRRPCP